MRLTSRRASLDAAKHSCKEKQRRGRRSNKLAAPANSAWAAPAIDNELVLAAQPEVAHQRTEIALLRIGEAI
ncbi:MAG: hypothetical protein ACLPN5_06135, partial [Roseiarcus sp.]